MIHIGLEAKRAFHNKRGLGNYARTLIEGLVKYKSSEFKLSLFTPPYRDVIDPIWEKSIESKTSIITPSGFLAHSLPSLWRTFYQVSSFAGLDLNLYHGLGHELPLGVEKKMKTLVTIHDLIYLRYPEYFSLIDRKIFHQKVSSAVKRADLIIAICEQTKEDLIHFLNIPPERIRVHYQACHPRFYEVRSQAEREALKKSYSLDRDYILYVGAFEERKNLLRLIEAYQLSGESKNVDLVLIGNGSENYVNQVRKKIADYRLEKEVKIFSTTPSEDLPTFYQMASLFTFPSFFEGFGIPIAEALFSKTPVLTSKGSCFPETGGPSTLYCLPYNSESIAAEITKVLNDKLLAENMRNNGYEFVQKFHLKNTTEELSRIYQTLS